MTDTYSNMDNVIDMRATERRRTISDVMAGIDGNPDEAANAERWSRTSGVPAPLIDIDPEGWQTQQRKVLSAQLVDRNDILRQWAQENPMASKVAADDWHNLDTYTQAAQRLDYLRTLPHQKAITAAIRGFKDAFELPGEAITEEAAKEGKTGLGWLAENYHWTGLPFFQAADKMNMVSSLFGALFGGAEAGLTELTGNKKVAREALGFLQIEMMRGEPLVDVPQVMEIAEAARLSKPFVAAGKDPPVGLHPITDKLMGEAAKVDRKLLDEVESAADATNTKERSPELFEDVLKSPTNVEIPPEAARRHADELSKTVKDFEQQLANAEFTNGRVRIPLDHWNTYIDKEVRKALKDDIAIRADGLTQNEFKELPERPREPPVPEGHVRFYHGADEGADPTSGGPRWATPSYEYARMFRAEDRPKDVHYVDIPRGHPSEVEAQTVPPEDVAAGVPQSYRHIEIPEELAKQLKPLPPETEPPLATGRVVDQSDAARFRDATESLRKSIRLRDPLEAPIEPPAVMPKARQQAYMKKVNKARQESYDAQEKMAVADIKKERSSEYKDAIAKALPEVERDITDRPDWAAYNWFRKGELRGAKVPKGKIDPDFLTPEQRAMIPKDYLKEGGMHPDVAAKMFGLDTGEELVNSINEFHRQKGDLSPKDFFQRQVGLELKRMVDTELGMTDAQILDLAQDRIYTPTEMDLLHEDVISAGMKAGQAVELSVGDILRQIKDRFAKVVMRDVDFGKINSALYRASNIISDASLKGKWVEAYRGEQQKRNAYGFGLEVKKILQEKKSFDRLLKMYGKREIENRDPQATNFIHDLMSRIEAGTRRKPADIAREIAAFPETDLKSFVERINDDGYVVHVPEFLYDKGWAKSLDSMTTEEWRGVRDAITSLDKYSRDQKLQWVAGEERDYDEVVSHMQDKIKAVEPTALGQYMPKLAKTYWAQSVQLEAFLNRLDQGNPLGIFNQAVVRDYTSAINNADAKVKHFGTQVHGLGKELPIKDPYKSVVQNFFFDQRTGEPIDFARINVLAVLQNMGNPGNFWGMIDGWKIPRELAPQVVEWVRQNTTKEDWERAQGLGKIFNEAFSDSQKMRRELSGVGAPEIDMWSDAENPLSAFGKQYEGWYHPLIYDLDQPQSSPKLAGPSAIEYPYWQRTAMTAANYAKQRTGYKGPILLEMDQFQHRLEQMARDTALRPTLTRLNKLFKDDRIVNPIKNASGEEMSNLLKPFLSDMAGTTKFSDANTAFLNRTVNFVLRNAMFHLVGLNPVTLGKHTLTAAYNSVNEVGAIPLGKQLFTMFKRDAETSETNWRFAMDRSEELQRRLRHYQETIAAGFERTYGDLQTAGQMKDFLTNWKSTKGTLMRWRDLYHWVGAAPLAFFDQMTAVPTWLALYKKSLEAGLDEGQAIFLADRGVRRAHGSTAITNKSAFARNNPLGGTLTAFYGFFSHILMKQYEAAWASRAALRGDGYYVEAPVVNHATLDMQPPELRRAIPSREQMEEQEATYRKTDAFKNGAYVIPTIAGMAVSYFIMPSLIEELIQPENKEKGWGPAKKQTWYNYLGKVEARGLSGSWLGVRDIVHGVLDSQDPSAGMIGTIGRTAYNAMKDITQPPKTTKQQYKLIKDSNSLLNIGSGMGPLPNATMRTGVFGTNWYMGKEKPKTFHEWWAGLVTSGTAHPRH